ncbi:MAG: protein-glutamate O-methyltransferase CheR [Alphaproteobacteria bacterium]|nr:MAG: protein-glutamate O-methyltransferase CheR [Alphaproteobacteria bacterium]
MNTLAITVDTDDYKSADNSSKLDKDTEKIEIELLLSGIHKRYGYDFSHYSQASLRRRLIRARDYAGRSRFSELLDDLLHNEKSFDEFLKHMSITVTEMFRDPGFYLSVREKIVPVLKTFPFIKIWHAGCATGEEVYSMAILLEEEGFLDRTILYATDFNKYALETAQEGVYPRKNIEDYAENYRDAGGKRCFSDYYSEGYDLVKIKNRLKERITFSYHNLVTDGVFGEMNIICCRNVMIYFDKFLQNQVLWKFSDALRHGGFLCLGSRETLNFSEIKPLFETVDTKQRIYKKTGTAYATQPL